MRPKILLKNDIVLILSLIIMYILDPVYNIPYVNNIEIK